MKRVCLPNGKVVVIDVTPDKDKVDLFDQVERLRDSSHVRALTFSELKNIMEKAGLVNLRFGIS